MGTAPHDASPQFLLKRPARQHEIRWDHPGWFIMRALRLSLADQINGLRLPAGATVLDFGCARRPYRELLPADAKYSGADLPGNPDADIHIQPDGRVPVETGTFDLVLSTQVLEHVADPAAYIRECHRVLRPGGHLLITTHGLWIYHKDPVDYWRWTAEGLQFLVRGQGLEPVHIEGLMGLAAVGVQLFQDSTFHKLPRLVRTLYGFLMQRLIAGLDRLHSPGSRVQNAMVYVLLAKRIA
jgi:SAM-dependent methyltransferase